MLLKKMVQKQKFYRYLSKENDLTLPKIKSSLRRRRLIFKYEPGGVGPFYDFQLRIHP